MSQTQTVTETVSVWAPTEAGAKRKQWLRGPTRLSHPALPKPPKAKTEDSAKYQLRLAGLMEDSRTDTRCGPMFGRDAGQGFYFVATDGARALLRKGQGTGAPANGPWHVTDKHASVPLPADFQSACLRMLTCVNEKHHRATVQVCGDRITVRSLGDSDCVIEASEWCEMPGLCAAQTAVQIDLKYLIDGLGRPSVLHYQPANAGEPIIIEAEDGETRYVLMPLRF